MSAIERMAAPLLFAERLQKVRGKTRLQKLICLLDANLYREGKTLGYDFQLYHYGPFSFNLMKEIEDLVEEELLKESSKTLANGYTEYSYSITQSGRLFLRSVIAADPKLAELRSLVDQIVRVHGDQPLRELVNEAYSARTDLVSNERRE